MLNTDETILRLEKERREIVARYDKGVDANDTSTVLVGALDKYGFPSTASMDQRYSSRSSKKLSRKEQKWLRMIKNWNFYRQTSKFIGRVYKGIPDSQRSFVWSRLLDITLLKETNPGMFQRMKEKGRSSSPEIRQIDLDVNRTFRHTDFFSVRYCNRQQILFNVLAAYSAYNTEVGYCQGMNNLAAVLTMYIEEEEDVFWGLAQLMTGSKWGMHGFFTTGFPKYIRFESYFDRILLRRLPRLKSHMEALGVNDTMYLVKWFMNCFIDVVPFSLTLRIMDVFLLHGERILLVAAYTIFQIHKARLLSCRTLDAFLELLGANYLATSFGGVSDDKTMNRLHANLAYLEQMNLLPPAKTPDNEKPRCPFAPDHILSKDEIVRRATMNRIVLLGEQTGRSVSAESARSLRPVRRLLSVRSAEELSINGLSLDSTLASEASTVGEEDWDLLEDLQDMPFYIDQQANLRRYPSVYDNLNDNGLPSGVTSRGTDTEICVDQKRPLPVFKLSNEISFSDEEGAHNF